MVSGEHAASEIESTPANFRTTRPLCSQWLSISASRGAAFRVWRQQPHVGAFFEAVRKVCQDVGDQLAVTALRADQVRQQNKVALTIFSRHHCGDQPAVVDSLPPMVVPSASSSPSSSSSSSTTSSS